jgi:hypothetical protein
MVRIVLVEVAPTIFSSTKDQTSRRTPHGLSGSGPGPFELISGGKNEGHIGQRARLWGARGEGGRKTMIVIVRGI